MDVVKELALYEFSSCPYCARVRNFVLAEGKQIELRDVQGNSVYLEELIGATGSTMVPCLRIEDEHGSVQWMHESSDIIDYLRGCFAQD